MSIDNINDSIPTTSKIHADYKFSGTSYVDKTQKQYVSDNTVAGAGNAFVEAYAVPLSAVRDQLTSAGDTVEKILTGIESTLLSKIYVNPFIDPSLEETHNKVWKEACNALSISSDSFDPNSPPDYICFDQYVFAENYASTASRKFISEFDELISQSTFSYFFQLRKLLKCLLSEITNIQLSLLTDFGEDYENESQRQIATRYDTWAKMAIHYSSKIASTILSKPGEIPYAEVDKISKKQAAQFQAFFTIRLNAVDEEIEDILDSLKRDLIDNSEIFYKRFLSNSLKMTNDVVEPLDLDYQTTNFASNFPSLAREISLATHIFQNHFSSLHADLIERFEMMTQKIDGLFGLIYEKRRFANYITQLSEKAVKKVKILTTVVDDKYSSFFRSIVINTDRNDLIKSSHGNLDDLEADHHPQYLLKNGGTISGDISVDKDVKIDGVSLSQHTHNGFDGSAKISPLSIDYESIRSDTPESYVQKPLSVTVDSFVPDILNGGIPVFDTIVNIEVDDADVNKYEYEIVYTEIEK